MSARALPGTGGYSVQARGGILFVVRPDGTPCYWTGAYRGPSSGYAAAIAFAQGVVVGVVEADRRRG